VVLAMLSIMFAYSAKLICWSFDKIPVGMVPSYPNLGFTAFGNPGHWLVMLMGVAEFFGASCMCLIIVWQSIEMLLPPGPWCFLHRTCISSRDAVVIGSPLIMLPAIWIRTFSRLTSISISGILSSLILIAVVVTAFALDPTREAVHDPSSSVHKAVNWAHLPIATGILIVSLSGHAGLPSLRRSMKNPQNFKFCLNLAFLAMFLLYVALGCLLLCFIAVDFSSVQVLVSCLLG
jgi:vesicular inhibitory amino acid transporter